MIRKPRFKRHLRVEVVDPDLAVFLDETDHHILQGRLIHDLVPLINGRNTISDLARRLRHRATRVDVECGLLLIEAEGLLADADDEEPPELEALADTFGIEPAILKRNLSAASVRIVSLGSRTASRLASILQTMQLRVAPDGEFTVVLVDDYLRPELEAINAEALRHGLPWMIARPVGNIVWLGPVFRPPITACWACLARRLKQNREAEAFLEARNGSQSSSPARRSIASNVGAAIGLTATEVLKAVALNEDSPKHADLVTVDINRPEVVRHFVQKLDDCASCGAPRRQRRTPPPFRLRSRKTVFTSDGGYRSATTAATFTTYSRHISPLTGIVDVLRAYHSDPRGIVHAYTAGHIFIPKTDGDEIVRRGLRQTSAGKGATPLQAQTSALCEALERYSGVFRGDEPRKRARMQDFGDAAIHPNDCMHFSPTQYANREAWNRKNSAYDWVPNPFDETSLVEWTPVRSLTTGGISYLPTMYCYYGFQVPDERRFCRADSNGNAAGNTLEEAILHGFLELVERDCAAIWWYNRIPRPALNLDSFGSAYFNALRKHYRELGRHLWVLDITSDFGIPTFAAASASVRSRAQDFIIGLGSHLDPSIAASRALTEMNQFLPGLLSGKRNRVFEPRGLDLTFLKPLPGSGRDLRDFPTRASGDFRDDITLCVRLAQERGMETLVLDQTRSDVGLPVVKVVVPGMRQFWARLGPGRLFEVPVGMGWLRKPLTEETLNPARFFI